MTTRLLPRGEWHRLKGTLLETVTPDLRHDAQVVVVEDNAAIVGCWVLMPVYHAEGVWIAPEHRGKASVGRRLLAGMRRLVREQGAREVLMLTTNDRTARMALKLGRATELTARHFAVEMGN